MKKNAKDSLKNFFSNGPKTLFVVLLILTCATVTIFKMRNTISVVIDSNPKEITTLTKNLGNILDDNGIVLGKKDKISMDIDSKVEDGDVIYIKKAKDIEVAVDGKNLKIKSAEDNIDKMLKAENIKVQQEDKIFPSKDQVLKQGLNVKITRVETKLINEKKFLTFKTKVKKSDEFAKGTKKVIQKGKKGEKLVAYKVVYENGKEVSRRIVSETIKRQPITQIISMGTLGIFKPSRGGEIHYKKKLRVRATAYTADFDSTGKTPDDPYFGITCTGARAKRNPDGYSTIAVDPRVIPMGSKVYVEGYGYAVAEDVGGAIKGNIIDLYFHSSSEMWNWGSRHVNVYILK